MNIHLSADDRPMSEWLTDIYIITMLLVFPLFPGFSGYRAITISKYVFFLGVTGIWVIALAISLLRREVHTPFAAPQWAALAYLAVCLLSWLCSPDRAASFLGAGRYDGLVTTVAYILIFLCVSAFARPKPLYAKCFALSVSLCSAVALLQLAGCDPLRLYPDGLSFYDAGTKYTGVFLGTIGNTNILDALLCLALPLFGALYVCGAGAWCLPPLLLSCPVVLKAGGDGGKLAFALTLLLSMPLLLTELSRLRRALRCGSYLLLISALTCCWQPATAEGSRFVAVPAALWLLAAAAVLLGLSLLPAPKQVPAAKKLRLTFAAISLAFLLAGIVLALCTRSQDGTLYELGQLLRFHVEDSYGSSRIRIWRECLALVRERPLLGGGPGTAAKRLNIEFSRYVAATGQTLRTFVDNTHNVYLAVLVNTGVSGLAALLVLAVLLVRIWWERRALTLTTALGLGALCCAIQDLFGLGLCLTAPMQWIFLGLICASEAKRPKTEVNDENDME